MGSGLRLVPVLCLVRILALQAFCPGRVGYRCFLGRGELHRHLSDPVGDQDLRGGIDGDKLAKEQRELEIRQKIEKLQQLKRRGETYDTGGGPKAPAAEGAGRDAESRIDSVATALYEKSMAEAETFFQRPNNASAAGPSPAQPMEQATSSVGGNWQAPEDSGVETYKPSQSGSWGVFERPKDISRTFGGGRRVGIGAVESEAEVEQRKEAEARTQERLAKYRKSLGAAPAVEQGKEEEIRLALDEARVAMARGICSDAVSRLDSITPYISFASELGGKAYIELGMACEAVGDSERAQMIYRKLAQVSSSELVRKQAKQLLYGFQAMEFFGMRPANSEASRLMDSSMSTSKILKSPAISAEAWSGQYFDGAYDATYFRPSSQKTNSVKESERQAKERQSIGGFQEARDILLRAAAAGRRRQLFASTSKVNLALQIISEERGGAQGVQVTAATDDPSLLDGKWRLVVICEDGQVQFLTNAEGEDARNLRITREFVTATGQVPQMHLQLPLNAQANCRGSMQWPDEDWQLDISVQEAKVGPMPLPFNPTPPRARLLTVDQQLHITSTEPSDDRAQPRYEVWLREK